jgi:hypothetical protein
LSFLTRGLSPETQPRIETKQIKIKQEVFVRNS